ncbi:transketolase [Janibacter sp. HTCC2649]|nr:transketolase [Janibacter sp. HTCC2649]
MIEKWKSLIGLSTLVAAPVLARRRRRWASPMKTAPLTTAATR